MSPSQCKTSDASENEDDQQPLPVTSFLCQWKQPRKTKKSNLCIGKVQCKRHHFGRRGSKNQLKTLTQDQCTYTVQRLLLFQHSSHQSEILTLEPRLGVSVLMDETLTSQYKVLEEDIPQQVEVLVKTLTLSEDERRRVESNTRELNQCKGWYEIRKHRLTASNFGKVLTSNNSKPEGLVKQILYPQDPTHIPAIVWGREKEATAVHEYLH